MKFFKITFLHTRIQKHTNKVVATRLKKFYTNFNQAIQLAEAKYGDRASWYADVSGVEVDEEGNPILSTSEIDKWFQKYFSDYIVIKKKLNTSGTIRYYLSDGSAFQLGADDNVKSSRAVTFFPGNPDKCPDMGYGQCKFYFLYVIPSKDSENFKYHKNGFLEPDKWRWDGEIETLYDWCKQKGTLYAKYCTALIQVNGWEIPEDYPLKVSY